jgi:hypothetical protein
MADEEQLRILRQGAEAWNDWRRQAPDTDIDLRLANLREANLSGAHLGRADLNGANLAGANLAGAKLLETILSNVIGLSGCKNLESIVHFGPSSVDIRTLQRSGQLPLVFLRGVGLPDALIEYLPSLLNQAIQHYSCSGARRRRRVRDQGSLGAQAARQS